MEREKLLLVEDDTEISEMLGGFLEGEGYDVVPAFDGQEACTRFEEGGYALVLLDLMIPVLSGTAVLREIRRASTVPVIILSARDTDSDKTLGLALGADDYVTKPFSVAEVLARIKANIRRNTQYRAMADRSGEEGREVLRSGELELDLEDYTLRRGEERIELTAKEFEILRLLMANPRRVYTKEQLYSQVWREAYLGDENAVNVHISRLRNKLEEEPRNPRYIQTVWGIGYKWGIRE